MSVVEMNRTDETAAEPAKGGKKKLVIILVAVLAIAGGGYWFFLKPTDAAAKEPEPGEVMKLDAIQINLTGGHYLRIGIALQASKEVHEELDGSKALDATIETFSGRDVAELSKGSVRKKLKAALEHDLEEAYHGEVIGVYFTDFVTQ